MEVEETNRLESKPALRDWIVIPLLVVATVGAIVLPTEFVARRVFHESTTRAADCLVVRDSVNGIHGVPNSSCTEKPLEGKLVNYRFNSCGNRAGMECGPKPPGTYRIVLLGTSIAEGLHTPFEKSFAALLPSQLSRITGRRVQVYDEGIMYGTPHLYDLRFKYVLAQQPDLILWTITKWDIDHVTYVDGGNVFKNHAITGPARASVAGGLMAAGFFSRSLHFARVLLRVSPPRAWKMLTKVASSKFRSIFMLKHFLYESQTGYLKYYLMEGEVAAYLRVHPGARWERDMRYFNHYAADIAAKARAAGVPLVATAVPERAAAAMISRGEWPDGYDPYKFGDEVRAVIEKHGGTYVDVMHGYRSIPNPEQYWLPVDIHPTPGGHAVLTALLAKSLTSGVIPTLEPETPALRSSAGGTH